MNICILIISEVERKSSSSNTEQTSVHPLIFIRSQGAEPIPVTQVERRCTPVQVYILSQEKHENIKTVWC